jgi:5-methylcytosine-specific restriction protein B
MNLSHVERYFADFLSAIESGEPLALHQSLEIVDGIPSSLKLPPNVFIIGTVNVDETTYTFSPKVLDRANCIEFRMDGAAIGVGGLAAKWIAFDKIDGEGRGFAKGIVIEAQRHAFSLPHEQRLIAELRLMFDAMSPYGAEFGFRTASDVRRFLYFHERLTPSPWEFNKALDAQVLQKLLPKLNGTRRKLEPLLCALAVLTHRPHNWDEAQLVITNRDALLDQARRAAQIDDEKLHPLLARTDFESGMPATFPLSYGKIIRMLERLSTEGFTSFAEA